MKSPNPILPIALTLCCVLLIPSHAPAQQNASTEPTLQQELQRLGAAAAVLDHSLPSFTCQETVVSQRLHRKKVKQQANFTATLRVNRAADGKLTESFWVTILNGKPFSGGTFSNPIYVSEGFAGALRYFAPNFQACYRYSISPGRIGFKTAFDPTSHPGCKDEGMYGFALLDPDGNVTHLERHVSSQATRNLHEASFAAIDFTPVELNGQTYRLSHHLLAEMPTGRDTGHFEATYTDCHLYTATVTLGPATEVPQGDTPQPQ